MTPVEICIYFVLGLLAVLLLRQRNSRPKNYPPGPRFSFPLLGHIPYFPRKLPFRGFMEWEKKYGPIMAIDMGCIPIILVNDPKLIRELFSKPELSERTPLPSFLARSGGVPEGILFTGGRKWMEQRRFIFRTLRDFGFGRASMEEIVLEEVKDLIEIFRKSAGTPQSTRFRFNASVLNALWTIMAGERFKLDDPELLHAIQIMITSLEELDLKGFIGNFIPIIAKYAPNLSGYQKIIDDEVPVLEFLKKPIEQHKATIQPGQPRDFIDAYLDEIRTCEDPTSSFYKEKGEKSLLFAVHDLFNAGTGTTSSTLQWAFLYLAKYPKIQQKLQAEIQKVIGNSRLPAMSDRPAMPYTEAVLHEIMRMSSLVPAGNFHYTTQAVEFGGFTIPKDTTVVSNLYAAHFNKQIWGDPDTFRPERFLNKDGVFVKNDAFLAFSTGKRVCIGETLARAELFLFTVSLFQAFTVAPVGSVDELSIEPHEGGLLVPKRHELILTERN